MGTLRSIDKIAEGLYICGIDGLLDNPAERLQEVLDIRNILNVAQEDLYNEVDKCGEPLRQKLQPFECKILGAADQDDQDLAQHFETIVQCIQAGIDAGGIAVHCAGTSQ